MEIKTQNLPTRREALLLLTGACLAGGAGSALSQTFSFSIEAPPEPHAEKTLKELIKMRLFRVRERMVNTCFLLRLIDEKGEIQLTAGGHKVNAKAEKMAQEIEKRYLQAKPYLKEVSVGGFFKGFEVKPDGEIAAEAFLKAEQLGAKALTVKFRITPAFRIELNAASTGKGPKDPARITDQHYVDFTNLSSGIDFVDDIIQRRRGLERSILTGK